MCFNWVGSGLPSNFKTWLERVSKDKCSSLLGLVISNKGKKSFITMTPGSPPTLGSRASAKPSSNRRLRRRRRLASEKSEWTERNSSIRQRRRPSTDTNFSVFRIRLRWSRRENLRWWPGVKSNRRRTGLRAATPRCWTTPEKVRPSRSRRCRNATESLTNWPKRTQSFIAIRRSKPSSKPDPAWERRRRLEVCRSGYRPCPRLRRG